MSHKAVILCVDDEENALLLRKLVLRKAGFEVLTATSASSALEIAASQAVDLVLSDHLMPGQSGVELTRLIKSQNPALPVLLLSGVNEMPPGAEAADGFLSKVEGPDRLREEIVAILSRSAGEQARTRAV
jgi:CheY-like chemotaxis protein